MTITALESFLREAKMRPTRFRADGVMGMTPHGETYRVREHDSSYDLAVGIHDEIVGLSLDEVIEILKAHDADLAGLKTFK